MNVNKLKWIIAQKKENREAYVSYVRTKLKKKKMVVWVLLVLPWKNPIMLQFKLK